MRVKEEKHTVTKSIKLTEHQAMEITAKAKAKNMTFSSYAADRLIHDENNLTPEIVVRVQEIVNKVNGCDMPNDVRKSINEECKRLWELLK